MDSISSSVLDPSFSAERYGFSFPSDGELNFQEAKDKFEKDFIQHALHLNFGKNKSDGR